MRYFDKYAAFVSGALFLLISKLASRAITPRPDAGQISIATGERDSVMNSSPDGSPSQGAIFTFVEALKSRQDVMLILRRRNLYRHALTLFKYRRRRQPPHSATRHATEALITVTLARFRLA